MKIAPWIVVFFAACADDSVPSPSTSAPAACGDAGLATFACCLDTEHTTPTCKNNGWTCLEGWTTCP